MSLPGWVPAECTCTAGRVQNPCPAASGGGPSVGHCRFATPELAETEIIRCQAWRKSQRNKHVERSWFLCAQCMQYHLTSQENN